jgi:hypothetical protein
MVRTPGYDELVATGEDLRRRLASAGPSVETIEAVVDEIRTWQRRCAWVVVARSPRAVAGFRAEVGSFLRPLGARSATSDAPERLDAVLSTWVRALDRLGQDRQEGRSTPTFGRHVTASPVLASRRH